MTLDQLVTKLNQARLIVGGEADAFLYLGDYTQQPTEVHASVDGGYLTVSLVGYGDEASFADANSDEHTVQV